MYVFAIDPTERSGRAGRCRHRRHGFGPGHQWAEYGPGPGSRGPRGRGRKARRGDIRTAALLLLAEEPRNGYQIMQEVEERSEGWWRPSPGSVYPALSQLEDEGLIRTEERDGRKLFAITDAGREVLKERGEDAPAPWEQRSGEVGAGSGRARTPDARGRLGVHAGHAHRRGDPDRARERGAGPDQARPLPDPRRRRAP